MALKTGVNLNKKNDEIAASPSDSFNMSLTHLCTINDTISCSAPLIPHHVNSHPPFLSPKMCPKQFPLEIVLNLSVPPTRLYHGSPVTAGSLFVGLVEQRASLCRSSLFFGTVNNDLPVTSADQRGLNELRLPLSPAARLISRLPRRLQSIWLHAKHAALPYFSASSATRKVEHTFVLEPSSKEGCFPPFSFLK